MRRSSDNYLGHCLRLGFSLLFTFIGIGLSAQESPHLVNRMAMESFKAVPRQPPALAHNPSTPEKIALGKMLYFDPRLSPSGKVSCNTCHNLATGGTNSLPATIGHSWQNQPRNIPTIYNAVFNRAMFWDGRSLDRSAATHERVEARVELAVIPEDVVTTLQTIPGYKRYFETAFPTDPDPINFHNVTLALECFQATLITPNSRFDRFLAANMKALAPDALAGLAAFPVKGCPVCHQGTNLGGDSFYPFGVFAHPGNDARPVADRGRFLVTKAHGDEFVFRASPLRNIALTAPYFHSGEVNSLKEAVAIMSSSQLGYTLTEAEIENITAFLLTLTGTLPQIDPPQLP